MNDYGMLNYASVRVAIDRQNELTRAGSRETAGILQGIISLRRYLWIGRTCWLVSGSGKRRGT